MFDKLPWSHSHEAAQRGGGEEDGESLTTILSTPEDRAALTILIADCTQAMQRDIVDAYDADKSGTVVVVGDLENESPGVSDEQSTTAGEDEGDGEKERKDREKRRAEIGSSETQDMKSAALSHFDQWRDSVIQRVGEVVNSREEALQHKATHADAAKQTSPPAAQPAVALPDAPRLDSGADRTMQTVYPPVQNPLRALPDAKRALILHALLLLMLSLEHYQAQSRVLMLRLCTSLRLSVSLLAHDETTVAQGLLTAAEHLNADAQTKKKADEGKSSRKWKVGLAGVAGAALIGVTGGLAAPFLAAGIGTVMGGLGLGATAAAGYLGTLAGSGVLVGSLFGAYGGRMTGKWMDQYAREVEDFAFLPVQSTSHPPPSETERHRLRVGIGVSGWLTDSTEVVTPWKVLGPELETFALRWELDALLALGHSLTTLLTSAAWTLASKELVSHTVFAALSAGLWPLSLLQAGHILENPWSVASHRASKAGAVLADALIHKAQGERPVTLVGASLGAKLIHACLARLAERRAFGLVEHVVLLGTPVAAHAAAWRGPRAAVAGRLVNVFSPRDAVLAYLHRGTSLAGGAAGGIAGLQPVRGVAGVENVDVGALVEGHTRYRFLTGALLRRVGFADLEVTAVQSEAQALQRHDAGERRQQEEAERSADGDAADGVSEQQVRQLEREVQAKMLLGAQGAGAGSGAGDGAREGEATGP